MLQLLERNAWFDSEHMFCISLGFFFGRILHIFNGEVDSHPEVFSLRPHAADVSALSPDMRARTWKSGNYFFEVLVAGSFDDGADFLEHLCQTQGPGVLVQPGSQTPGCPAHIAYWIVGCCGRTQ